MYGSALTLAQSGADARAEMAIRTQQAKKAVDPAKMEQAQKVGRQFEAMFMTQMLQHMFEGVGEDQLFGGGHGEQMFRSLMLDEYGKMMVAKGPGIGLADQVARQMLKTQEV